MVNAMRNKKKVIALRIMGGQWVQILSDWYRLCWVTFKNKSERSKSMNNVNK